MNTDDYLNVTFTGSISGATASEDSRWVWNFGDGSALGHGRTVSHIYSTDTLPFDMSDPIEYMIALDVTTDSDSGGIKVETSRKITLSEPSLSAAFLANVTSGNSPLTVEFTDMTHGRHAIVGWDFDDQSDKPAISPVVHTFDLEGTYSVVLTVSRGVGETSKKSIDIVVKKPGPVVSFRSDVSSGKAPLTVKFTDLSTVPAGNITERTWDFGDGTTVSNVMNPEHIFEKTGNYTVVLTVKGNERESSDKMVIYVKKLEASFYADKTSGPESLSVQFTSDSVGNITSYYWDFGDGHNSVDENPVHIYHNAGIYDVTLTVSGPDGSEIKKKYGYIEALKSSPVSGSEKDNGSSSINASINSTETVEQTFDFNNFKIPDIPGAGIVRNEFEKLYNFFREYLFLVTHL
ncbi:PKD repeat protein [Methanomicrobium sp. W14]|uniref:PKD domain-containing protein n=1 Tax=Methanomicrobium sp. W14 TaxID=2817839 RepID=UPI001AE94771|nr:PKD domain-containing protein [Methanomicrobium sp. W14]MBP2134473.1 PKD repeat protein [Methanomicrobium sp. W14]